MININYLFYFSSENLDVFEIKRLDLGPIASLSEIYKWLAYSKVSQTLWELDFKSMHKSDDYQYRLFMEGHLRFNDHEADFKILGQDYKLLNISKVKVASSFDSKISAFIEHSPQAELRNLKPSDIKHFRNWIKDEEVIRYSMTKFHSLKDDQDIQTWYLNTLLDAKSWQWGIVDPQNKELIGYIGIAGINKIDNNGEFFIFIGNKNYWGKKLATKLTPQIVKKAFADLNLHRIFLTASSDNPGAVKAYEKAGFIHEGIMRDAFFRNGQFSNKLIMGILKEEMDKKN